MSNASSESATVTLADGRLLSFSVYGDPAGKPVIALHGTPGSRLKFQSWPARADVAVQLVCPDRWGYGGSSMPRRSLELARYVEDVAVLAEHLGLDRFALLGVSGGAPYATAAAALLGGRVTRFALAVPVGPMSEADNVALRHRLLFQLLPRLPGAERLGFGLFRAALAARPEAAVRLAFARAAPADRRLLGDRVACEALAKVFREGLASGVDGAVVDMTLFAKPWRVDWSTIVAPTRVYIGRADRNVSNGAALALARLTRADVVEIEGAGHLWPGQEPGPLLAWLTQKQSAGL